MGRGWYRHTIETPEAWRGKRVLIEFEGVYMNAEISLDENYLGRHPYGYTSFTVDLTPYLKYGETQKLTVSRGQLAPAQQPLVLRVGHLPACLAAGGRAGTHRALGRPRDHARRNHASARPCRP